MHFTHNKLKLKKNLSTLQSQEAEHMPNCKANFPNQQ
jgi:hypothetical protein